MDQSGTRTKNYWHFCMIAILAVLVVFAGALIAYIKGAFHSNNQIKPVCRECNIILLSVDTLAATHLPCYGYKRDTAPFLCSLAEKGTLFRNTYSHSSFTLDSHLSIMTSLYPTVHGVVNMFTDELHPSVMTLPKLLKGDGYRTIYVGQSEDDRTMPYVREGYGFDDRLIEGTDLSGWELGVERFLTNVRRKNRTFLFMHTYATHDPYMVGSPSARKFTTDNLGLPSNYEEFSSTGMDLVPYAVKELADRAQASKGGPAKTRLEAILRKIQRTRSGEELRQIFTGDLQFEEKLDIWYARYRAKYDTDRPTDVEALRNIYDDLIVSLDIRLRSILTPILSDPIVRNNTVIVITSDHGEAFKEHGSVGHDTSVYAEETRVPLIIMVPGKQASIVDTMTQSIDIAPTLTALLGLPPLPLAQGKNLFGKDAGIGVTVAEHRGGISIMVRDERYSLLIRQGSKPNYLLYDRSVDPAEQTDVASAHADIVSALLDKLRAVYAGSPKVPVIRTPYPDWVDEGKRQRLIRQGYF